jgi:hypothetical protein
MQTVYGLKDLYTLLEIVVVDRYNERLALKKPSDD